MKWGSRKELVLDFSGKVEKMGTVVAKCHQAFFGVVDRLRRNLRRARELELTPRQREVLILYYDKGLKMHQIARRLGVNESTVSRTGSSARANSSSFQNMPEQEKAAVLIGPR